MNLSGRVILFLATLLLVIPVSGATEVVRVNRQVHLMGTVADLEIYADDRESGLDRLESFIGILEGADHELSTWKPDSTITRLNHHRLGFPFSVEPALCRLLGKVKVWQRHTGGAFDPAIGTLIAAWGIYDGGRIPSAQELEAAIGTAGLEHVDLDEAACEVRRTSDVLIDVGGFGKGEALDRVLAHSVVRGLDGWMINLGGQVLVHGTPPGSDFWPVAVAHSDRRGEAFLELKLVSGSLATSGGSERDVETLGQRIGHVIDPRTGHTVIRNASVTVWHAEAFVADILSTALYVMGEEEGLAWAEEHRVAVCFLIPDAGGEIHSSASSAFATRFFTQ